MRLKKTMAAGCFALAVMLLLSGCSGKKSDNPYTGKWAYNHDTTKTALKIEQNGKAELDGQKYTYTSSEEGLVLKNDDGDKVRVVFKNGKDDENGIFVYKPMFFTPAGECDGLIGVWNCGRNSFEFTSDGTFREDGYFPGYYTVDADAGVIKLVYNDMFEDTYIPYSLTDKGLQLEYPWEMIRK